MGVQFSFLTFFQKDDQNFLLFDFLQIRWLILENDTKNCVVCLANRESGKTAGIYFNREKPGEFFEKTGNISIIHIF